MSSRPPNPTQLSPNLPGLTRHITTHTPDGKAAIHSSTPGQWTSLFNDTMAFNVIYTTSTFPPNLSDNTDIKTHENLISQGPLGLTNPGGSVCRIVDFGPRSEPVMHRTESLDYGVVLEGEVEMQLDSGEARVLRRGDVAVQRGTNHAWRNTSESEWARMLFVLQPCEKIVVGGREIGEDLGKGKDELKSQVNRGGAEGGG